MKADHYEIEMAGIKRSLPLFEVAPGVRIAVLNILGDTELVEACATAIADKLKGFEFDVLFTAESKSIPFAHALSVRTGKPYVVCRKNYKSYMGKALKSTSNSMTTQQEQLLILDEKDIPLIKGKKVVIVDDVISTGSTLHALTTLLEMAGSNPDYEIASILTEGAKDDWPNVICLGHLPIFKD